MVCLEASLSSLLFILALAGPSHIESSQLQDRAHSFPGSEGFKSHAFNGNLGQPRSFKPNPFAHFLSLNKHTFAAEPPSDLASELEGSTLPASSSSRKFRFSALSGANFLSPTGFPPMEFRNTTTRGVDTSRLWDAKLPDLDKTR